MHHPGVGAAYAEAQLLWKPRQPSALRVTQSQCRPRRGSVGLFLQALLELLRGPQEIEDLPVYIPQDGLDLLLHEQADHLRGVGAVAHAVAGADHPVSPVPLRPLQGSAEGREVRMDVGEKDYPHDRPPRQPARTTDAPSRLIPRSCLRAFRRSVLGPRLPLRPRGNSGTQRFQQCLDAPQVLHPSLLGLHFEGLDVGEHGEQN